MRRYIRRQKNSSCHGKVRYRERSDADADMRRMADEHGFTTLQRSYYCPSCNGFHLTSTRERVNGR